MKGRIDGLLRIAGGALSSFFKTRAILKLLAIVLALTALTRFALWLPTLQVRRGALPGVLHSPVPPALGTIAGDAGLTLAAENGGRKMYVDPATLNIRIVDEKSGLVWNALCGVDAAAGAASTAAEERSAEEQSIMRLTFVSVNDLTSRWNSYTHSLKQGGASVERIPNGVRINLQIGNADPTDINYFMPRRIPIDRYEAVFVTGLENLVKREAIAPAEAARCRDVLALLYARDDARGCYYNKFQSSPPASTVRQMLAMTRLLGYTVEQLVEDEAPYDLPVQERDPPVGFLIPLEFTLEEGDLVAKVSSEDIEVQNDYYTLTQLILLPNFGAVSAAECESGSMLIPDGAGALAAMNAFNPNYNGYERPFYFNTLFRDKDTMPQYPEDLKMPVFGMIYGSGGGFLGIVEAGDETAFMGFRSASARAGSSGAVYNAVYAGFDIMQYQQARIAGADTHGGSYLSGTGMLDMEYRVRYKLFAGPVGYFDLASAYKQYLIERYALTPRPAGSPKIYLDVSGAVTVEGRFLGKAYQREVSMTGYAALAEILRDLEGIPKVVAYSGVFNRGADNRLTNRADLAPQNGSRKELEALMELAAGQPDTEFYWGSNFARVYRSGNGYSPRIHAAQGYDGEAAEFRGYHIPTGLQLPLSPDYTLLNPLYLPNAVEGFLAAAGRYENIYVNDLADDYYASYKRNALVPPLAARTLVDDALRRLGAEKKLALNNPSMDKIVHAAYAVNISRESSNYGGFYTSIPFRQLVLNGLTPYTTLDVNGGAGESWDYYLLQALELGSLPKFHITAQNADPLKYTRHTEFLSTQYALLKGRIKAFYEQYAAVSALIGAAEIVNHETPADKVYVTSYRNGVSVAVNYNHFSVETGEGLVIPPLGYVIMEAGE